MRFCSRCGLPVSEVAEWLAGGGALAVQEEAQAVELSPKRKVMRHGAKVMFWGGALLPVFFGLSIVFDSPFPLFIPFIILLAGLTLWLYSRMFGEEAPSDRSSQAQDARLGATQDKGALPPASDAGINSSGRRQASTVELVQPPSVTENTTKLLEKDMEVE